MGGPQFIVAKVRTSSLEVLETGPGATQPGGRLSYPVDRQPLDVICHTATSISSSIGATVVSRRVHSQRVLVARSVDGDMGVDTPGYLARLSTGARLIAIIDSFLGDIGLGGDVAVVKTASLFLCRGLTVVLDIYQQHSYIVSQEERGNTHRIVSLLGLMKLGNSLTVGRTKIHEGGGGFEVERPSRQI